MDTATIQNLKKLLINMKLSLDTACLHISDPSIKPRLTPSIVNTIEQTKILVTFLNESFAHDKKEVHIKHHKK